MASPPPSKPALSREALAAIAALDALDLGNDEEPESLAESFEAEAIEPEALEPDADDLVLRWDGTLDRVDYFTLLRLAVPSAERDVRESEVRGAFHAFALAFHPDRYRGADDAVREAANRVYCRGGEAYRVLLDPLLRRRYVRLIAEGTLRMSPEEIADATQGRGSDALADLVKSAAARPFAQRADELIAAGDLKQARLQLRLALTKEPRNVRLEERMRELEAKIGPKAAR